MTYKKSKEIVIDPLYIIDTSISCPSIKDVKTSVDNDHKNKPKNILALLFFDFDVINNKPKVKAVEIDNISNMLTIVISIFIYKFNFHFFRINYS
ncbi:hypothetical protein T190607A02C_40214 [Tenacibaculum sp. 190524A02b]